MSGSSPPLLALRALGSSCLGINIPLSIGTGSSAGFVRSCVSSSCLRCARDRRWMSRFVRARKRTGRRRNGCATMYTRFRPASPVAAAQLTRTVGASAILLNRDDACEPLSFSWSAATRSRSRRSCRPHAVIIQAVPRTPSKQSNDTAPYVVAGLPCVVLRVAIHSGLAATIQFLSDRFPLHG
jgi:hypothetical protein